MGLKLWLGVRHTRAHTHTHTKTQTHTYIHTYTYTHIHAHTFIHTHTYTPTHTPEADAEGVTLRQLAQRYPRVGFGVWSLEFVVWGLGFRV